MHIKKFTVRHWPAISSSVLAQTVFDRSHQMKNIVDSVSILKSDLLSIENRIKSKALN